MVDDSRPSTEGHASYPAGRENTLYVVRFLKTLFDSEATQELTANAITLLSFIVYKEDDLLYRRPVLLFNEYLQQLTGLTKSTMPSARDNAVENGWLYYSPGGKSVPGTYWTLIPSWAARISEAKRSSNSLFRTPIIHPENRERKAVTENLSPEIRTSERETNAICHPENRETNAVCHPENRDHIDTTPNTPPTQKIGWGEVESRFREIGLIAAEQTIREATAHGCSAALAMAVAEHFAAHPGAWQTPGIVRAALLNHPPALPADHPGRWPKPSGEYEAAKRSKAQDDNQARETVRREEQAAKVKRDRELTEARENRYGSMLDGLSESEQLAMCEAERDRVNVGKAFIAGKPLSGITRSRLLSVMEKRSIDTPKPDVAREAFDHDEPPNIIPFVKKVS